MRIPAVRQAFGIVLPTPADLGWMLASVGLVWLSMEAAKSWLLRRKRDGVL